MPRYDSLMDDILRAGLGEAIKAGGFKRRRPRLYVRERDWGYEYVTYRKASKYGGDEFFDEIGVFYQPVQDLYDELFPEGIGDNRFPNPFGPLPAHIFGGSACSLWTSIEPDPDGPHAHRIEFNDKYRLGRFDGVTNHFGSGYEWYTERSDTKIITDELIGIWQHQLDAWLDYAADMAFAAAWYLSEAYKPTYAYCHAATFYHLAGDERRAKDMLLECLRSTSASFEALEKKFRDGWFFGIFSGRSTERSRERAKSLFDAYQKVTKVARRLAGHFGYELPIHEDH